jgi:hypothetical protein
VGPRFGLDSRVLGLLSVDERPGHSGRGGESGHEIPSQTGVVQQQENAESNKARHGDHGDEDHALAFRK